MLSNSGSDESSLSLNSDGVLDVLNDALSSSAGFAWDFEVFSLKIQRIIESYCTTYIDVKFGTIIL